MLFMLLMCHNRDSRKYFLVIWKLGDTTAHALFRSLARKALCLRSGLSCIFLTKRLGSLLSFLVPEHGGCDMNSPYNS